MWEDQKIIEALPGCCYWKDAPGRYAGCNKPMAKIAGLAKPKKIEEKSDYDMPWDIFADAFIKADDERVFAGETLQLIEPAIFAYKPKSILCTQKAPYYDEDSNIVGIVCYSFELDIKKQAEQFLKWIGLDSRFLAGSHKRITRYQITPGYDELGLTQRESECLFLLLRSYSASQIAKRLNLSKRTVESYIDNLKNRLGCANKTELIIKAVENNLLELIPASLVNV